MSEAPSEPEAVEAPAETPSPEMTLSSLGRKSIVGALIIFTFNMLGAWWLTYNAAEDVARPLITKEATVISRVLEAQEEGATANGYTLLNRMVDAEVQIRAAQNAQTLCIVAMAASFGLMAIGFALFVMGAEGAFQLEGKAPAGGNLVLKSTAPGIICFVLATLVLWLALHKQVELSTGAFQVFPDDPTLNNDEPLLKDAPPLELP